MSRRERWAWFGLLVTVLLSSAAVLWLITQQFAQTRELTEAVERSHRTQIQLRTLLSLQQDIEVGQRGFLLTADRGFLDPYTKAKLQLKAVFRRLEHTGASWNSERLQRLSEQKLDFADRTLALAAAGDFGGARQMVARGEGKRLMDAIRAEIIRAETTEAGLLQIRSNKALEAQNSVRLLIIAVFVLMTGLLLLAIFTTGRAANARSRATARYRRASARQEAIFRSARDGMITVNMSGTIEGLNPAIERMTGYKEDELARQDVGLMFELAPDQGRKESFLHRLARESHEKNAGMQELVGRRKDGTLFPCEMTVSPVQLDDGVTYVAVVRDTSERKEVDRMKSEFVSTVSHELRTPLTSIAGSLGLLSGGAAGVLPDKAHRLVHIAKSNCERLVRLINDILDMEKLETSGMDMKVRPVELGPFLGEAIRANRAYAEMLSVNLQLEPFVRPAEVYADYDRLMQVMTNLFSNAAKFSPPGQTVNVAVAPLDRRWRISVRDRGSGIPQEFRQRMFGKFAQADSADSRQKGGTGLGLSIVRQIVTQLGGSVTFEDAAGGGTVFHVDLPAVLEGPCAPQPVGVTRVLHVEDDLDVIAIVADAASADFVLTAAHSLQAARAALDRSTYDVVILDFALPDGSGTDLIPELRKAGTDIIVFTAQDADPAVEELVDVVLVKSRASLQTLVGKVRDLLEARAGPMPKR